MHSCKAIFSTGFLFTLILLLSSCAEDDAKYAAIAGTWQAADWLIEGDASGKNLSNVSFQFNTDKTYRSQLGAGAEKGVFRIKDDYLYTQADNQLEIMVKINKLTGDSLVLEMNNAGQEEKLILVREK